MEDKILLLTDELMYDIEHNDNEYIKKVKQDFELCETGDKKLKGAILRINKIDKPLEKFKNTCYLVKSELYNNVYYPIDKYDECYEADFKNLIKDIAWNMGATKIKIYSKREEININKRENNIKVKANANFKIKVESELEHNRNSMSELDKNIEQEWEIEREKEKSKKTKMTKEEFSKWIEKEGINEKTSVFKNHIEEFKKFGEVHGLLKLNEEKSELSKNVYQTYTGIKAGINCLPNKLNFIRSSLSVSYNSHEDNERKLIKKFSGYIEF